MCTMPDFVCIANCALPNSLLHQPLFQQHGWSLREKEVSKDISDNIFPPQENPPMRYQNYFDNMAEYERGYNALECLHHAFSSLS